MVARRGPLRVRALVCVRCPRTGKRAAMSQTAIATDVHQALDVHLDALAQVAFDLALRLQDGTNPAQLVFTQIPDASVDD